LEPSTFALSTTSLELLETLQEFEVLEYALPLCFPVTFVE
jgi:hypothetical protein